MYKTISININTYQQLNAIAAKLHKPKSQIIDDLIREYTEKMHEEEKVSLKKFNASVRKLSYNIRFPKGTIVNMSQLENTLNSSIIIEKK